MATISKTFWDGLSQRLDIKTRTETHYSPWQQIWRSRALYFLILPTLLGMILFQFFPAVKAFYYSFFAWDGRRQIFTGLLNFRAFFTDIYLPLSLFNVGKLLVANLLKTLTAPLLVAYLIYRLGNTRSAYFYRMLYVIPMVIPGYVTVLFWRWVLSQNGLFNYLLRLAGLGAWAQPWLGKGATALYAIMFIGFPWVNSVFMLIYLAGLLSINPEIIDAAVVDGASGFVRLWHIELPQIMGQIKLFIILTMIGTLQDFWQILVLTDGGPGYATMVPALQMYHFTTKTPVQYGFASSIGLVLFIVIFAITIINQKLIRGGDEIVAQA